METTPRPPRGLSKPVAINEDVRRTLVQAAQRARQYAYAPYSQYFVGAALLATTGEIYTGCNVENAAYPATICAERVALVKAVSEGVRSFMAVAVATENGGFPCGLCRQMLYEFNPDMLVIVADGSNGIKKEMLLSDLLPEGFGPAQLSQVNPGHATP